MKKIFGLLVALMVGTLLFSCKDKNSPSAGGGGGGGNGGGGNDEPTEELQVREVSIHVLNEEIVRQEPYIRATMQCEDWLFLDVANDALTHNESRTFVMLNQNDRLGYYVFATPTVTILSQFTGSNMLADFSQGNVMVISTEGEYIRYAVVNDFMNNPTIVSQSLVKDEEQASNAISIRKASMEKSLGAAIYETMSRHFRAGSEEISEKMGWTSWLPGQGGNVAGIWSSVIFAVSLGQITDCNPDLAEEVEMERAYNDLFFMKMSIKSVKEVGLVATAYDLIVNHSVIGKIWGQSGDIEEKQVDESPEYSYPFYDASEVLDQRYDYSMSVVEEARPDYAITLSYGDVTETSANFYISIKDLVGTMAFISSMRLRVETAAGEAQYFDFYAMSTTINVSTLQPLTEYYARVEIYTKGTECCSNIVHFTTKGMLVLHPDQLSFTPQGGTKFVALQNMNSEIMKSFSVAAPSWCSIQKDALSFAVNVGAYQGQRNGTITVTAVLMDNTQVTASIPVKQEERSWDGTEWMLSGNVTTHFPVPVDGKSSITESCDTELIIRSVANNDFAWISQGQVILQNGTLSVNASNQLTINGSVTAEGVSIQIKLVATRTGEETITVTYNATGGNSSTQDGNFTGYLMN